jgi:hypothetical protein
VNSLKKGGVVAMTKDTKGSREMRRNDLITSFGTWFYKRLPADVVFSSMKKGVIS